MVRAWLQRSGFCGFFEGGLIGLQIFERLLSGRGDWAFFLEARQPKALGYMQAVGIGGFGLGAEVLLGAEPQYEP